MAGGQLKMKFDRETGYRPVRTAAGAPNPVSAASCASCPFNDEAPNEDAIGAQLFAAIEGVDHTAELGYYTECFAGYVADKKQRALSTSGGITTWLLGELLSRGMVDRAICVTPAEQSGVLFEYSILSSTDAVSTAKKARYYPTEVSDVLTTVLDTNFRYAFVGLPCTVKAVRLAALQDERLHDRIVHSIAIFCGHLKTPQYADYLSREIGFSEDDIATVDFRRKTSTPPAQNYEFLGVTADGASAAKPMRAVLGGNWGQTFFMQDACNWCDDVVGETADISLGDAWIPPYSDDPLGTNLVVVRDPRIGSILADGLAAGELQLDVVDPETVARSQDGSYRQRRTGLAYRLSMAQQQGRPVPAKRVKADPAPYGPIYRSLQRSRLRLQAASTTTFERYRRDSDNRRFLRRMRPLVVLHQFHYRVQQWVAKVRSIRRRSGSA